MEQQQYFIRPLKTKDAESALTDTAFPTWRITYNRGKIQYITAWEQ
jgi:hypothetical protein